MNSIDSLDRQARYIVYGHRQRYDEHEVARYERYEDAQYAIWESTHPRYDESEYYIIEIGEPCYIPSFDDGDYSPLTR